tara:strand:- start:225 stop:809 length:585 start_codon:yes stop_codon:yes gene_type:complete
MRLLFPIVIHEFEVTGFQKIQDELTNFIYKENRRDRKGMVKSNKLGWHSRDFLPNENNILTSTIINEVSRYFSMNRILKEGTRLTFRNMWVNINKKGCYNKDHIHPGSDLAGVFYIKTPKNCGNIEFTSPHQYIQNSELECYSDEIQKECNFYNVYWMEPLEGTIIMFPSHIQHRVDMNESRQDRISASFNLKL